MDLRELIDAAREEAHDLTKPYFWSDEFLTRAANDGEAEACRRGHLLRASNKVMCYATVTAGDPMIELSELIIDVIRVRCGLEVLDVTWADTLDEEELGWEDHIGSPTHYLMDYETGFLRLYPTPVVDTEVRMTVLHLPVDEMSSDSDTPKIKKTSHPALVQWMLHRGYAIQDADSFDPQKSARALAEFEKEFGKKASLRNETWQERRPTVSANPVA